MLTEIEDKLSGTRVLEIKDNLYSKFIVPSSVYKQSLVDSLANMDWGEDDEEDK
jgi:hypothetical protein